MNGKKILLGLVAIILLGSFTLAVGAGASTATTGFRDKFQLRNALFDKIATGGGSSTLPSGDKCAAIALKISGHISTIDSWTGSNLASFKTIEGNIKAGLPALQASGKDVVQITADLATLNNKVATLVADKGTLEDKLKTAQSLRCGSSKGQFASAVKDAQVEQETVNADKKDVTDFLKGTIKPEVQALLK